MGNDAKRAEVLVTKGKIALSSEKFSC